MERFIENYSGEKFDLVVIGGGITGAAVAYDAASRGLSVALLEKQDFGCATSAATSKLIHGGFRYLANFELGLVRESLKERRTLSNIAPNFVYPKAGILACYGKKATDKPTVIKAGMTLYDVLSFDKTLTWDKSKKIPLHRMLTPKEVLARETNVRSKGLIGGALYYDCASLCPERLTLAFIKSAVKEGAKVANYAKVEGFLLSGNGKIRGVRVKDLIRDKSVEIEGTITINCGGPWADIILNMLDDKDAGKKLRRSEGIHLITGKLVGDHAVMCASAKGGHFFLIPWRGHTLIGTTDKEYIGDPDDFKVTRSAIEELIEDVNNGFGQEPLRYEDVLYTYGGLRPLVEDQTKGSYESSRKYEIYDNGKDGFEGLITVEGGKYTTSRSLAEKVMQIIAKKLDRNLGKCVTAKRYLAGCDIKDINGFIERIKKENEGFAENTLEWLGRHYGTEYQKVIDLSREKRFPADPLDQDGEIPAQVLYAIREEMACTLKDIIFRRTGLGTLGDPGDEAVKAAAEIASVELSWDNAKREKEIAIVRQALQIPQ